MYAKLHVLHLRMFLLHIILYLSFLFPFFSCSVPVYSCIESSHYFYFPLWFLFSFSFAFKYFYFQFHFSSVIFFFCKDGFDQSLSAGQSESSQLHSTCSTVRSKLNENGQRDGNVPSIIAVALLSLTLTGLL